MFTILHLIMAFQLSTLKPIFAAAKTKHYKLIRYLCISLGAGSQQSFMQNFKGTSGIPEPNKYII